MMNRLRNLKLPLVLALLVSIGLIALPALAQTPTPTTPTNSLTVSGIGQASGSPDIAYVQLGVQISNSDVIAGFAEANERMQAVLDALREQGVAPEDLQTTGLFIYQDTIYDPQTGMPGENSLYRIGNSVNVTVRDVTQVSEIINTGVSAGANNINGLTFGIDDRASLEQSARAAAVEDARNRASELAALMGVTLGDPIIVVEGNSDGQFPIPYDRMESAMGGGVPVETGQQTISMVVRVTFAISQGE